MTVLTVEVATGVDALIQMIDVNAVSSFTLSVKIVAMVKRAAGRGGTEKTDSEVFGGIT